MGTLKADAMKLRHVVLLPYCRCLQRMRKFETEAERLTYLRKAKRLFAPLDLDDDDAIEDAEWKLGL